MTEPDLSDRLSSSAAAVEAVLQDLLGTTGLPGEIARPQRLLEAMRYVTLAGGKRLRPFLVLESAKLFGVEGPHMLRAAAAVDPQPIAHSTKRPQSSPATRS